MIMDYSEPGPTSRSMKEGGDDRCCESGASMSAVAINVLKKRYAEEGPPRHQHGGEQPGDHRRGYRAPPGGRNPIPPYQVVL